MNKEFIEALAKARSQFKSVEKDRVNPHYKNRYATLDSINKSVSDALSANGLVVTSTIIQTEGGQALKTILWHTSGESIESVVALPAGGDMQKLGSATTYARRYSISALLNVCGDEDDDGVTATVSKPLSQPKTQAQAKPQVQSKPTQAKAEAQSSEFINDSQRKRMFALSREAQFTKEGLKAMLLKGHGICSSKDIPREKYEQICLSAMDAALAQQWNEYSQKEAQGAASA